MHLNPAYIDRLAPNNDFKPPTKKKYEFDSLIEDLTKETKLKSRGEILLENNYSVYLQEILSRDMKDMNCVGATSNDPVRVARAQDKEEIFKNINRLMDKVDD